MRRWLAPALLSIIAVTLLSACADQYAPTATPTPLPDPIEHGVVATFDTAGGTFRVFTTSETAIENLFRLQAGELEARVPVAVLLPGDGAGDHNAPWSWHMQRQTVQLVEQADIACNTTPQHIEDNLEHWLSNVRRFCPETAVLVDITDYR